MIESGLHIGHATTPGITLLTSRQILTRHVGQATALSTPVTTRHAQQDISIVSLESPARHALAVATALIIILSSTSGATLVVVSPHRSSLPGFLRDISARESSVLAAGKLLVSMVPASMGPTNVLLASETSNSIFAKILRVVAAPMFHVPAASLLAALDAKLCICEADIISASSSTWIACPVELLAGFNIEISCAAAIMSVESLRRRSRPPAEPPPLCSVPMRASKQSISSLWAASLSYHSTVQTQLRQYFTAAGGVLFDYVDRVGAQGCSCIEEVPAGLRALDPASCDPALATKPFSTVILPPSTAPLPLTASQKVSTWRPSSLKDMLTSTAWEKLEKFLRQNVRDMEDMLANGSECQRLHKPRPLVLGQSDLVLEARDIVWDLRQASTGLIVPMDFLTPISTELNIGLIEKLLGWCPDRELLDHLRFGVDFKAELPLQTVLLPHMNSLAPNFDLVQTELLRLKEKGWHHLVSSLPFWPCRINPNGSVSRKLEASRPRRTTNASADGSSAAGPLRDADGIAVSSLNVEVLRVPLADVSDDPSTPGPPSISKWPKERKPTIQDKIHDISVLRFAGKVFKEPIVGFVTDFADYFSQFALHPKLMWANVVHWLKLNGVGDDMLGCFVNETRLGFGVSASSNICQRFAHAVVEVFRRAFDREEAELFAGETDPVKRAYLAARQSLGPGQCRLYEISCYTDDPMFTCVGIDRLARAMRLWHQITDGIGLVAAIPRKRQCGAQLRWLGLDFILSVGVLLIPQNKRLRALTELTRIEDGVPMPFDEYRAAVSFLQYLRPFVAHLDASYMYGLYDPFKRNQHGLLPSAKFTVVPSRDIRDRAKAWREVLASVGGALFSSTTHRRPPPPSTTDIFPYSDAALEGAGHPGLGGYCEGLYWAVRLSGRSLYLPISVLEFIAIGINMIIFADYVGKMNSCFCSDSLNSVQVFNNFSAKSTLMQFVHSSILALPVYGTLGGSSSVVHVFGPSNPCSDAASRGRFDTLFELCTQLGVAPVMLTVPPEGLLLLKEVCDFAERRGLLLSVSPRSSLHRPVVHRESVELASSSPAADGFGAKGTMWRIPRSSDLFRYGCAPQLSVKPVVLPRHSTLPHRTIGHPPAVIIAAGGQLPFDTMVRIDSKKRLRAPSLDMKHCRLRTEATPSPSVRAPAAYMMSRGSLHPAKPEKTASFDSAVRTRAVLLTRQLELDPSPEALRPSEPGALLAMCTDYFDSASTVLASGTKGVDDLGWRRWCIYCSKMGTPPIRPAHVFSRLECRDRETILQRQFVVFCASVIEPRSKKYGAAKPQSSFNMLLAVKRIHKIRFDIPMVIFPGVATALKAITKAYILEHGAEALLPERKEPLDATQIGRILALPHGTGIGAKSLDWADPYFLSIKALLCTGFAGAFRKAELCLPEHVTLDERRLRRSSVSWIIGGAALADPSNSQLVALRSGDFCVLKPPLLKNDPFGLHFGTKPIYLPVYNAPACAARAIAAMLIASPVAITMRATTALFCGSSTSIPLRHSEVDKVFHLLLLAAFPGEDCTRWSVHSLRIGAACALLASGASTALIQAIGRWRSTKSIDIYARLGAADYGLWLLRAAQQTVDAITARNLPRLDYDSVVSVLDGPSPTMAMIEAGDD